LKKKVEHFKEVLIDTCNTLLHKRGEGLYTLDMQKYLKPQKTNFNICTLLSLLLSHGSSGYAKAPPCEVIRTFSVLFHYNTIHFSVISLLYLNLRFKKHVSRRVLCSKRVFSSISFILFYIYIYIYIYIVTETHL
jgi:hypothetical protein